MGNSQPFAQISILGRSFHTGDGYLESATLELGEDERASTCQFRFYDPRLEFASYLFQLSQSSGGITTPSDLLQAPEQATSGAITPSPVIPAPTPQTPAPGVTPSPVVPVPTPVVPAPSGSPAGTSGESSTGIPLSSAPEGTKGDELAKYIIQYCRHPKIGITSVNHQAAILANIQHETVMGVYTEEIGGASTRYAPWFGRGLIQLTWESNYKKAGDKLGLDFVSGDNRNLVKQLKFAIPIACIGMRDGWFTGKKLADYGD
jgi:hypothetical protein